ncbi:MAG: hypothetical protein ACK5US_09620, partial [Lysobacteraceae bacterium]
ALDTGGLLLDPNVDGMPVIVGLFRLASKAEKGEAVEAAAVDRVFARHVEPLPVAVAARTPATGGR